MTPRSLVRRSRQRGIAALALLLVAPSASRVIAHEPESFARVFRLRARLDGAQVVRPPELQPPELGSGSSARAVANLEIDDTEGHFVFELAVTGIDPDSLDNAHGPNDSAVQLRVGRPDARGAIVVDVHHFARQELPGSNGVTRTVDGFELFAIGDYGRNQGLLDTGIDLPEVIEALRTGGAYVDIRTSTSEVFRPGEVRGRLELVPEKLVTTARVDGEQVVRPEAFQPPSHGSGSAASGTARFELNTRSGFFRFDLGIAGIDPDRLDGSHGPNRTAIHLHTGSGDERGPIILDVHHFARTEKPATDGVTSTEDGFELHAEGRFTIRQGVLTVDASLNDLIDAALGQTLFVAVHTTTNDLFRAGEVRGNFARRPTLVRVTTRLDESQVIREPGLQPPARGTGSDATAVANLRVDEDTGAFDFELDVVGIRPEALDGSHGANETAVQIRWGFPTNRGPIALDVHHFARSLRPESNGIVPTESGFRLEASGFVTRVQGAQDTQFTFRQLKRFLHGEELYVSVHTTTSELFRGGEIRGNLAPLPPRLVVEAQLDGGRVVRPERFRPPLLGSGSEATGDFVLSIDTTSGDMEIFLEVAGIEPTALDDTHGPNRTAIHLHHAPADELGPMLLDIHHLGRLSRPRSNGLETRDGGFGLVVRANYSRAQGDFTSPRSLGQLLAILATGRTYVTIHTTDNDLYRAGEIRGNPAAVPEKLHFTATIDESQVVRPPEFQPPLLGTGSPGVGVARLAVDSRSGDFDFALEVEGLDFDDLMPFPGANRTSVRILRGDPISRGTTILDVHLLARWNDGVRTSSNGFSLEAEGLITQSQGQLDTGFARYEILDFLRAGDAHILITAAGSDLLESGALRGNIIPSPPPPLAFVRGDCNGDGRVAGRVDDAVFVLNYSFTGGPEPGCFAACDANSDGRVSGRVDDAVYLLNYSFLGGPPPEAPFPDCAESTAPGDVELGCNETGC